MPGVQKPHCVPPCSTSACWMGCSFPPSDRPSIVTMSRPGASRASTRQALTAAPSTITVQVPQLPLPQPSLVPVSPMRSRSRSSSVSRVSASTVCSSPLTVQVTSVFMPAPAVPRSTQPARALSARRPASGDSRPSRACRRSGAHRLLQGGRQLRIGLDAGLLLMRCCSADVARIGVGPTDASATRASAILLSASRRTQAAVPAMAMSISRRGVKRRYVPADLGVIGGKTIESRSSPGARLVLPGLRMKVSSNSSRDPLGPATRTLARWQINAGTASADGAALQMLPPRLARFCTCRLPISRADRATAG